ncbi:SGNH/GDSL hydrolase family protein [Sphingomonas sp. Root241]|uniref:SGNH/GDSL hydrolase family protein n=1 Tax=Sphingomonas sp. Root241 TaxID=1736501 RepID=UPI0006F1D635|nr:SGNH/GDSL hydrolase family protein [Sphingomonas sp. Root241]KRC81204.1 lipase [Sphingomonas sp. Root241]
MKALLLAPLLLVVQQAAPLPVHVGGRVVTGVRATSFGWPGVYFESRFRGPTLRVITLPRADHLRLLIDGKPRHVLKGEGVVAVTLTGLGPGEHVARLEKLTESQSGSARFGGFFADGGDALPAVPRKRQIEFVGDSHSVGYGDTSPKRECTAAEIHDTTDTQQAFGPILAKRLGADYRVIAYSGYGIVRNYAGNKPGENLPFLYDRAIPGDPAPAADDPAWRPQTIVINLGTNDFSTPLKSGEAWADAAALRADYRTSYVAFVRRLRAAQPQARFVLMAADAFRAEVEQVAAATGATVVDAGPLELTGCDWHPSLKDQRAMADRLQAALAR